MPWLLIFAKHGRFAPPKREQQGKLTIGSMACAIREAYAATLTVVILVDDQDYNDDD